MVIGQAFAGCSCQLSSLAASTGSRQRFVAALVVGWSLVKLLLVAAANCDHSQRPLAVSGWLLRWWWDGHCSSYCWLHLPTVITRSVHWRSSAVGYCVGGGMVIVQAFAGCQRLVAALVVGWSLFKLLLVAAANCHHSQRPLAVVSGWLLRWLWDGHCSSFCWLQLPTVITRSVHWRSSAVCCCVGGGMVIVQAFAGCSCQLSSLAASIGGQRFVAALVVGWSLVKLLLVAHWSSFCWLQLPTVITRSV
ncbi:GPI-anchored surface protein, putative, partial [Bodo saltans]